LSIEEKIFRDPIYGYISIPETYCKDFIDTAIFQRLRRIEQTSMRVLYPSAHHDRFAHSIGVFYLGKLAFSYLEKNSKSLFQDAISDAEWQQYKNTFEIACLMHDCGHSPFSHTFEHYYLFQREPEIEHRLSCFFEKYTNFINEYRLYAPAPHEKISGLLLLEEYFGKIESNHASPQLAARMIMGVKYDGVLNFKQKFENKLISLLNGAGIDVDSLDYIQRDSWISGVGNVNIDYQRLLSSIMIKLDDNENCQIVFKKKVLSVIDNISIGRNFLYKWIYSHHKVIYEQLLLENIIEKINSNSDFCKKVFSIDSFTNSKEFQGHFYLLPTDDDIIHTIKQYIHEDEKITELLSRNYKYKALWKTYFEFNESYFRDVSDINRMKIFNHIQNGALSEEFGSNNILSIKATPKLKNINENDFFIEIDNKLIDASKATSIPSKNLSYFIVYVSEELRPYKDQIIKKMLSLQS